MSLKVLTLNCWGLPLISKLRNERMVAIGKEIAKSSYEIVAFQEVWHKGDYEILKSKIGNTLPYSHYFYSGVIGSGLCVFSKHRIDETLYHVYELNGYAHKILHADWYGGKGVGLAKINIDGYSIHIYTTHLHAEYNRENDEYLAHRISQSLSLSQFIKLTSTEADVALLCGDLNLEPVDLGYKIMRSNGNLRDAWLDRKTGDSPDGSGNTSDRPGNSFHEKDPLKPDFNGKRIDYILYKHGKDVAVEISECSVTMGRVPDQPYSFSDHEGLEAKINFNRKSATAPYKVEYELSLLLDESITIINRGQTQANINSNFFILFGVCSVILSYLISIVHFPFPFDIFAFVVKVALILATGYSVVNILIMIRSEVHGLKSTRETIKQLLGNIAAKD